MSVVMRRRWLWLLCACACAHAGRGAETPACVIGGAPAGTLVEVGGGAQPMSVTVEATALYELCGMRPGAYRVRFSRNESEIVVPVTLAPGERRRLHVCEREIPGSLERCVR
jgi:hypothetical protein